MGSVQRHLAATVLATFGALVTASVAEGAVADIAPNEWLTRMASAVQSALALGLIGEQT